MKHVIVIETPDENYLSASQRGAFESNIVRECERVTYLNRVGSVCVVHTAFFRPSAVNAVCEMYGNDYRVGQENKSPDNGNEGNHVAF